MPLIDKARHAAEDSLNVGNRDASHVALGLLICASVIAVTATVAVVRPQPVAPGAEPPRHPVARAVWPALFSVTTLAAVRVWNAPSSRARTRSLSLWGGLQGLNLLWMIWRPRDKTTRIVAALTTAGLTAAYAHSTAEVDETAAGIVAPTGLAGLAALVARPSRS
jgi:benzodiazapine receptor